MNDRAVNFLKELVETPSPSGFEQPVQRVMRRELEPVADEVRTDVMGNVIARIGAASDGALRVMLAGHCDEIGFMVRYIDDKGFIYFAPIGGVDAHLVPGQRVHVHTAAGPVLGVVGKKPIHLMEAKDRETVVKLTSQFIDLGCVDAEAARNLVAVGDPVTFAVGFEPLQGALAASRGFDDKMGAFIVAEVLRAVRRRGVPPVEVFGVSTVQEEVGLRGATTSTFGIDPHIGIAVDVGFASDVPGVEMKEIGEFKVGGGPIISRGANIHPALFELLVRTAREEDIPCQIMGAPRGTGTDANAMQLSRAGVAAALVQVPLRYMHSPVEVLSLDDIDATIRLLTGVLFRLDNRFPIIPD
ncbi:MULTISPECIES: M42 family metallopeptidase [Syntrophotalea]|jgi:endoglucanase|uniref:Hydrolase n=1 Tax=Syntrophotalea acetylenica TaxID=29542 RepID=A0A1L3GCW5_SYNAC|nr:M42 family metallopeptidase [Syntrophotalea acetylenica]APG23685.1 hydrolase [Syntrophotalea acetylenica]APG44262.1 hydrolase [Syntrophotalea acetylenica]MDY0262824.1 M42 family metallopeptidase [Syntrophotalea acetylenica]